LLLRLFLDKQKNVEVIQNANLLRSTSVFVRFKSSAPKIISLDYVHVRIVVLNIFTRMCSLILDWFQVSPAEFSTFVCTGLMPREAVVKAAMLDLLLCRVHSPDLSKVYRRPGIVGS
jgi:hypothetical protein